MTYETESTGGHLYVLNDMYGHTFSDDRVWHIETSEGMEYVSWGQLEQAIVDLEDDGLPVLSIKLGTSMTD